jgi:hypothetical protein
MANLSRVQAHSKPDPAREAKTQRAGKPILAGESCLLELLVYK